MDMDYEMLFSENDCIENGMVFTWTTNRSIEIEPEVENVMIGDSTISLIEYQIKEGQDILFEFNEFSNICDDDILDGSGSKKFSMIIPSDSMSSFSYTDQEILKNRLLLMENQFFLKIKSDSNENLFEEMEERQFKSK
jgi:hypothetical protein